MEEEVLITITEYKEELEVLGITPKKIILYGSYAAGKAREHSDLDLLVVSDDFEDMDLWERLCLLGRARKGVVRPIEILGLTEEEFEAEGKGTFIGNEVKLKGIEVV